MNQEDLNQLLEQDLLKSTPASIEEVKKKEFRKLSQDQDFLDKCAIAAMQGILSAEIEMRSNGASYSSAGAAIIASESYIIAKEMLKARKEPNS